MSATFIHPPGVPYATVNRPQLRPGARPGPALLRRPFNTLSVIRLAFTDPLRFIGRPRVSNGYLATGRSRR